MREEKIIKPSIAFPLIITITIGAISTGLYALTNTGKSITTLTGEFENISSVPDIPMVGFSLELASVMEYIHMFVIVLGAISLLLGSLFILSVSRYKLYVNDYNITLEHSPTASREIKIADISKVYKMVSGRMTTKNMAKYPMYYIVIESNKGEKIGLNRALYRESDIQRLTAYLTERNPNIEVEI